YCFALSWAIDIPRLEKANLAERLAALRRAVLPLGFPLIILGGIYTGIFSPTEAAAVSVLYAGLLEFVIYRELPWRELPRIALSTGLVTAVVFVLVGAGAAFSWVISFAQIPQALLHDTIGLT